MKKLLLFLVLALSLMVAQSYGQSGFDNFISRNGDKLMDGKKEFRFVSYTVPCLFYLEDQHTIEATHAHSFPNEFEITDALQTVKQLGGQVIRTYTFSVRKKAEDPEIPRHILAPGKFNEDAFVVVDKALELANKFGIRLIIPLGCQYAWWGGFEAYADFRDKNKEEFWTDRQLIDDYKATISYVLNRKNTFTGVAYKDDKAILAWSTGAELLCPYSWTAEIAGFIKSIDKHHLVLDGYAWDVREEALNDPNIDIVKRHLYPERCKPPIGPNEPGPLLEDLQICLKKTKGIKPLIITEFGLVTAATAEKILDKVVESSASGALLWSLRYHRSEGGFYWHTERWNFRSYHWPGFPSGNPYDETEILNLMRKKAFEIQGLSVPPVSMPEPPVLLPISKVSAISWKGSVGAKCYDIERSENGQAPWVMVGQNITDDVSQYKPLFNDDTVEIGKSYYYRVKAKNATGISKPSNVVGPVMAEYLTLVDEMQDCSKIYSKAGTLSLELKYDTAKAKEEAYRLKGEADSQIIYKLPGSIASFKLYGLFANEISDSIFSVSQDNENFTRILPERNVYTNRDLWKPVIYQTSNIPEKSQYLRIQFTIPSQISRVEITYHK